MAKFKIGDRVRVVKVDGKTGAWEYSSIGKEGVVMDEYHRPDVMFDDGGKDWGSEDNLEPVGPKIPKNNPLTTSLSDELTHITIGGKRFRLVAED